MSRSVLSESGISLPYCDTVDENDATLTSASSLSSDLLTKDTADLPSPSEPICSPVMYESTTDDGATSDATICNNDLVIHEESDNAELSIVLDSALAAVYNSISTLERQKIKDKRVQSKDTPDLVMDLPLNGSSSPLSSSSPTAAGVAMTPESEPEKNETEPTSELRPLSVISNDEQTTAEFFAQSNQCTLKKGSSMSRSTSHMAHLNSPSAQAGPSDASSTTTVKRSTSSTVELNDLSTITFPTTPIRETNINVPGSEPITVVSSAVVKLQPVVVTPAESSSSEDVWQRRVIDQPVSETVVEKRVEKTMSAPPLTKPSTVEINLGLRKVQNFGSEISSASSINSTSSSDNAVGGVSSFKPKPKLPPPVMKKPNFKPSHSPSPELVRKFAEREYRQTSC